jgi:hypothetical protein
MMRGVLAMALAGCVLACNKPKTQPPPAPGQVSLCARVADHLVSLMSGAGKHPPEATDPLRRVIGDRCDEDRWTDATKQCLLQLASLADGERCQAMMTPAQVEAFQRDSEAATVELRGQFTEEPPGPRPAGSAPADAGSSSD